MHTDIGLIISIASDHAGVELKEFITQKLQDHGARVAQVIDQGPFTSDRVDYPDYARKVCESILNHQAHVGILICGSGVGMSMMANRFHGIRCALVSEPTSAALSKQHNNSNVLSMGARLTGPDQAWACVEAWLRSSYEGGRHDGRIAKLDAPL